MQVGAWIGMASVVALDGGWKRAVASGPMRTSFLCFLVLSTLLSWACAEDAPVIQYAYHAEITRVVTGDSVELDLDLGFGVWLRKQTMPLVGIEAPDINGPQQEEALKWKAKLTELLKQRAEIIVQTTKDKKTKPARYLVTIWADGVNINEEMKKPN